MLRSHNGLDNDKYKGAIIPIAMFLIGIAVTLIVITLITSIAGSTEAISQNLTNSSKESPANSTRDKPSPEHYVPENEIRVYTDHVTLDVKNVQWATFADTKSMLPLINNESHGLQIIPKCPDEIEVGDIVSYSSQYSDGIIIHRIVYKDTDNQGTYFILKGDNNPTNDPGKIRCNQIQRRLIGIIY